MSHQDYVNNLCIDSLTGLIEIAQGKLKQRTEQPKKAYIVVCDDVCNHAFFHLDDTQGALEFFTKEFLKSPPKHNRDTLQIEVQKWYEHEMEDLVKESK